MREEFQPVALCGSPDEQLKQLRFNCLGSLFYFVKIGLRRKRLTENLHLPMCRHFEKDHLKELFEMARDHFKSTIASEGLPVWKALPFNNQDEDLFKLQGYSDEFIRWMRHIHDPHTRILLVSENITNAAKLGKRIRWHFESNSLFRSLFPEILPTSKCTWTNYSLEINRPSSSTASGGHGEGTFDFLGAGGALQSRHYPGGIIQDDLVGKKAIDSPSVMDATIEYHKLLPGAFEDEDKNHEGDEVVIGNRWGYHDLNSYIREHEPWLNVTSHSALGGCCALHPADTPIFPEEWSFEKLMKRKARLGNYYFSCQYLNNPMAPEDADFKPEWLNYYKLVNGNSIDDSDSERRIVHDVKDGIIRKDERTKHLSVAMACDPNHSGQSGRARHAIVVMGMSSDGQYYLLEVWAKACNYDEFYSQIYKIAERWRIRKVGFENIAAQKFAIHHIERTLNLSAKWPIRVIPLKGEVEGPDGTITRKKEWRIRDVLSPIFEAQNFWIQREHQDFVGEYTTFPRGRFVDALDALAYCPQMMQQPLDYKASAALLAANAARAKLVNQPYSVIN